MSRLIIGCGYLGQRVAQRWGNAGHEVAALTRSIGRARQWQTEGLTGVVGDVTCALKLDVLPPAQVVLYAVGFDRAAGPDMREVYVEGLRNTLAALHPDVERIVYISSTSVYAQQDGSWVDESSPCEGAGENGRICRQAEDVLMGHRLGERAIILRMAGIYGPGRIPRVEALLAGEPIPAAAEGWVNLIHVDDAAEIVVAAAAALRAPALYNVTDGQPVARREYYAELARLLGAPAPQFGGSQPGASRRAATDKRVSSRKLQGDLPMTLQFPSYREGLAAIVAAQRRGRTGSAP